MAGRERYEPLPEDPEDGLDRYSDDGAEQALLGCEAPVEWAAVDNLDVFFTRLYRYWEEKGFVVILTARVLNLAALAFTIVTSGVLLLGVDFAALQAQCLQQDTCNVWDVAFRQHPLAGGLTLWTFLCCTYLAIFTGYWIFTLVHLFYDLRSLVETRHFYSTALGLSERAVRAATWPEVASRLVAAQSSVRLCIARDLTEHDVVARIMRKENYLIGMLNKGVLALNLPLPGLRGHLMLTKTVEWNLYWCLLDPMIDDTSFRVRQAFLRDPAALRRRFRAAALLNAALSPFLFCFLVIYFFMKNAEALYHHPSSIGARRWSPVAHWKLREFNELPHFLTHRLNAGHAAAERYCAQFPNYALSHLARFVAFVAGSFAALLIALTLADERLLERDLAAGRQTVWWLALLGVVLAAARALVIEPGTAAFDPGLALVEVAAHTHHMPRHWRGRAHTVEVQQAFESLFRYRALLFLEELASVVLTPLLLWSALPRCCEAALGFVESTTTHVEGVGDICSLAAFDLKRHGSGRYGSASPAPRTARSRQGKVEKSLVTFAATYPGWHVPEQGQELLARLASAATATATPGGPLCGSWLANRSVAAPHAAAASAADSWTAGAVGAAAGAGGMSPMLHGLKLPMMGLLHPQYAHLAKMYAGQYSTVHHHAHPANTKPGQCHSGVCGADAREGYPRPGPDPSQPASLGGSLFAEAELCARPEANRGKRDSSSGGLLGGLGPPPVGRTAEERVVLGQAMLQSLYELEDVGGGTGAGAGAATSAPPGAAVFPGRQASPRHTGSMKLHLDNLGAASPTAAASPSSRRHADYSSELSVLGGRRREGSPAAASAAAGTPAAVAPLIDPGLPPFGPL